MDKKTQKILLFAGVGVVAYLWWKNRKDTINGNGATGGIKPPIVNEEAKNSNASGSGGNCSNIIRYDCVGRMGIPTTLVPTPQGRCMCPTSASRRY